VLPEFPDGDAPLLPHKSYRKDPEHGWTYGNHPAFTPDLQRELEAALLRHKNAFAYQLADLPGYTGDIPPFEIKLTHDKPIFSSQRRHSPLENEVKDKKCLELLQAGFICQAPPECQYASDATMPAKKDPDGNYTDMRMCKDYRRLNEATVPDRYGMHYPEDLFRSCAGSTIFSKLDCRSGFLQLPIAPDDQPKSAFWWRNVLHMYKRVPFGVRNGPSHFQKVVDREIAKAGLGYCAISYIDDIIIHSTCPRQHIADSVAVLKMLHSCGMRAHPDKSIFGASVLEYRATTSLPMACRPTPPR